MARCNERGLKHSSNGLRRMAMIGNEQERGGIKKMRNELVKSERIIKTTVYNPKIWPDSVKNLCEGLLRRL